MTKILDAVTEAYNNALLNGYNLDSQSPEEVAIDMQRCDATLENEPLDVIEKCVRVIQAKRLLKG